MLELDQAQEKILAAIQPLPPESVALSEAHGRFAAENVSSPIDLPMFDNSAMDGYAVQSKDVLAAKADSPVALRLLGRVAAGENFSGSVGPGTCVRLFTGSPMPSGADAVVMQEDTRVDASDAEKIWIADAVKPWENMRFRGEDVKRDSQILQKGERLSVGKIALLAAIGTSKLLVGRRPVLGLIATGSELIEPGQTLTPGKIYESNRVALAALAEKSGAIPKIYPLVSDTLEATTAALEAAFAECDAVVTSGGVSVGEFDFVKTAWAKLGGEVDFWRVAIKPGKPFVFGQLAIGGKRKCLFGVPGNPVSALVTFFLLVRPALLRWQGAADSSPQKLPVVLGEPLSNHGDRRHFVRMKLDASGRVWSAGTQASHILSALAQADGLVEVLPGKTLPAESVVSLLKWD
jgi:molybdopterin molybdotransferase